MSKIVFDTRVVGVNEGQKALVTSITRFLGSPIHPDDLFRFACAYQSLIRQGSRVKAHKRNNDNFAFDRDIYEKQQKEFKKLLSELQTKYTSQISIKFEDYTTATP